jgi:serine/threonine protein kinase
VIGQTVSHYRILEQLGEGGMGVVYRAKDLKLDRIVALKFLASEFVRDSDSKARFVHEAKAASALDHPNICTIHGIEETEDGRLFIAMACYQGETLKDLIGRGPLEIEEAVEIAVQVAQGLAKAHSLGIVHRDIKPANVFLTEDGLVKLLDFGIAKLAGQTQVTRTGSVLGTMHYMSPEQLQGEEVDRRTDLWSLGVVLYEMLSSKLPFTGEQPQTVMHAILNTEPATVSEQREGILPELELALAKCLRKQPTERYQGVEELLLHLRPLAVEGTTDGPGADSRTAEPRRVPEHPTLPRPGFLHREGGRVLPRSRVESRVGLAEAAPHSPACCHRPFGRRQDLVPESGAYPSQAKGVGYHPHHPRRFTAPVAARGAGA